LEDAARKLGARTGTEFCLNADKDIASAGTADGDGVAGSIHTHCEKCQMKFAIFHRNNKH